MTGTVRYINNRQGYFFIRPDHRSREVFGHFKDLADAGSLKLRDRVSYDARPDRRGGKDHAFNVAVLHDGN